MINANDRQVGGNHYNSNYQHWDWVEDIKLPYLLAAATKYLVRWRKKNGLQDVAKTFHYVEKFIEKHRLQREYFLKYTENFITSNKIEGDEKEIIENLVRYQIGSEVYLDMAVAALGRLHKKAEEESR